MKSLTMKKTFFQNQYYSKNKLNEFVFDCNYKDLNKKSAIETIRIQKQISEIFKKKYQSIISEFMPFILSVQHKGKLLAATGIHPASMGSLFVENYFKNSIESEIEKVANQKVARETILEIGNCVSVKNGYASFLFIVMIGLYQHTNFKWAVFTATPQIINILNKLNMSYLLIKKVDESNLNRNGLNGWGSYYETCPQVIALDTKLSFENISKQDTSIALINKYQDSIKFVSKLITNNNL
jgi:hypothetical protein